MINHSFHIPILFLIFNRPDTTQKVFNEIRKIKPRQLFVAADGPRGDHPKDKEKCERTRKIINQVDWGCEIKTLFQKENLGCGYGVVAGINWFFENVEQGIILEDDCLPDQSFFWFCQELLCFYKNDNRIMHINGNNYKANKNNFSKTNFSYHFGNMPQVWGWASWRRAWEKFDYRMDNLEEFKKIHFLKNIFNDQQQLRKQLERWDRARGNKIDTWDFQWQFSVISNNGLTIVPKQNLISNIGFGEDATHTTSYNNAKADLATEKINFPLTHPTCIIPDRKINSWYQKNMLGTPFGIKKVKNKIASLIKKI
jgi:hypothetical protein